MLKSFSTAPICYKIIQNDNSDNDNNDDNNDNSDNVDNNINDNDNDNNYPLLPFRPGERNNDDFLLIILLIGPDNSVQSTINIKDMYFIRETV